MCIQYTCLLQLTSVFFFQFSLLFTMNKRVRCLLSIYMKSFAIIWILTKETVLGYTSVSIRLDNLNVCCRWLIWRCEIDELMINV